jgi:hypothetical protein
MPLNPNRSRFWKRRTPTSLRQAVDESIEYFKEAHNGSVERVAERMGYTTKWSLYKDLADLKLQLPQVKVFEHACGIDLLTRYYAASANRISIEIPLGRTAGADSIQALQAALTDAAGALLNFYAGQMQAEEALSAVNDAMQELAWHRVNVGKHAQPELEF